MHIYSQNTKNALFKLRTKSHLHRGVVSTIKMTILRAVIKYSRFVQTAKTGNADRLQGERERELLRLSELDRFHRLRLNFDDKSFV